MTLLTNCIKILLIRTTPGEVAQWLVILKLSDFPSDTWVERKVTQGQCRGAGCLRFPYVWQVIKEDMS